MMMADGVVVDGSWELTVLISDLQVDRTVRVKGDLHVGGLIHKLVETMEFQMDWSDHGLWWPERNIWLTRWRSTLDKYNVQADSKLSFTPMHKVVRVQMPDLQIMDMRVDFSKQVFGVVTKLCKELGVRHPEEMSLSRKLDREELKKNKGVSAVRRPVPMSPSANHNLSHNGSGTLTPSPNMQRSPASRSPLAPGTPQGTLGRSPGSPYMTMSPSIHYNNGTMTPGSMNSLSFEGAIESTLANSPMTPTREGLLMVYRPKTYAEKARINAGWLDSSTSLMEQGVKESELLLLRFKYFSFYDLNPKYDAIRINQLYEQAKWALLSEELDCSEDEMMMFAALQLQVQMQAQQPQNDYDNTGVKEEGDDIDAALDDLEESLAGTSVSPHSDITRVPELQDHLKYMKSKKFTLKSYKRYWFTFKDTSLSMFKQREDAPQAPMWKVNLKGCEVNPEVNLSSQKFCIKLFMPSADGMTEAYIRADTEEQYAKWMAACKLASKGKTMADSSYESEVQSIIAFLNMQRPKQVAVDPSSVDLQPQDFVAPKFFRKIKTKQMTQRILEAHANVKDMSLVNAKLNYIRAWQALPEYGITYFTVRFKGQKKEELVGVASNRLIKMDLNSGDSIKSWPYSLMETWQVNWEIKQVQVKFESEYVAFHCLTADCKVVHEYIGGYIFLSMRSGDKSQTLDEEMFHKLTGGWAE